ncbi:hypothetical protein [Actinomadura monticuli]|uniref:Uncharacterized protein n=1 Tax=Actinomadura monticuli TaxID=3097367 RepID=A0ABV4QAT0_9ACTN
MPDHVRRVLRDIEAPRRAARGLPAECRQVCADAPAAPAPPPPADPLPGIRPRDEAAEPLVAALHRLVHGSPDEPFGLHESAGRTIGRAHGSGRPGVVRVHRPVTPGTVDEWIGEGTG